MALAELCHNKILQQCLSFILPCFTYMTVYTFMQYIQNNAAELANSFDVS